MKKILLVIFFLTGCAAPQSFSNPLTSSLPVAPSSASGFEMLPWLGGVAVLAGLSLIVISGARKGWYPLFIGVGLIILNWVVLTYAHALFIPVVVATGALTLALGYKAVSSILLHRKCKK